tara:strand:- start:642 stop:1733 length:1092 start_codon:yes stop_codon:yes gene_type:complete
MPTINDRIYQHFYGSHGQVRHVISAADAICSHRTPIGGALLSIPKGIGNLKKRLEATRCRLRGFKITGSKCMLIELPPRNREQLRHTGVAKAYLWESDIPKCFWLIGFKDDCVYIESELLAYTPMQSSKIYADTNDFKILFGKVVKRHQGVRVKIREFSSFVSAEDSHSNTHTEKRRTWLKPSVYASEFFNQIEEDGQRLRTVAFNTVGDKICAGRLRRDVSFMCTDGFLFFYRALAKGLHERVQERQLLFDRRGADKSPTHASRPIEIKYETHLFEDKQQNHRLVRVLSRLPNAGVSVFHANPYLHASVVDYIDGTSCKIWVTDSSAITVIPGRKSTSSSLARLCNHINVEFREGRVTEVGE